MLVLFDTRLLGGHIEQVVARLLVDHVPISHCLQLVVTHSMKYEFFPQQTNDWLVKHLLV